MSPSARLFFALQPDRTTRREIVALRRRLNLPGRRVPAARLHATLAFLGSQPRSRIGGLKDLAAALPVPRFELLLDRVGSFPRARVVWLGADLVPDALLSYHARLIDSLDAAGFTVDRQPWVPHVTLYRDLRTAAVTMDIEPVRWTVDQVVLMESISSSAGLQYRVRGRWRAEPSSRRHGDV